jgi:hypothetical protein
MVWREGEGNDQDQPMIYMTDIRLANHCSSGTRRWFDSHGLDFRDFLKNGIPTKKLRSLNDGFADRVIQLKALRGG